MMDEIFNTIKARGIAVVIPTYNNAGTILRVINSVFEYCKDIIVINDGSTDNTLDLLRNCSNITLITYARNRGKGYALKKGFSKAKEMGFSYAITMDADLQHLAKEIPKLVEASIEHPGSVIIGHRQGMDKVVRKKGAAFANSFSNFWFWFQTWHRIKDTQTGFRLYPIRKMWWLPVVTPRYESELEMLVLYAWHGTNLVETDVEVYYPDPKDRVSSFRPAIDFTRISIMNTVASILAVIYGWPITICRFIFRILRSIYSFIAFVIITVAIMTPIAFVSTLFGKFTDLKKDRLRKILNFTGKFVTIYHGFPGIKTTYFNPLGENFNRPAVIICNHQSWFDLMTILSLTDKQVLLTNDWVWNNKLYGYFIHLAEFYPTSEGIETIVPKLSRLFKRGISTMVFPEGTRSADCSIGRFHSGAFAIADELKADIIPVVIYGTGKVMGKHKYLMRTGRIRVEIDARIPHEQYMAIGSYREIASYMRKYYQKRYSEIRDSEERFI